MTSAKLVKHAYAHWLVVHQAIHGALTTPEQELTRELVAFLSDVTREDHVCGCDDAAKLLDAIRMQT